MFGKKKVETGQENKEGQVVSEEITDTKTNKNEVQKSEVNESLDDKTPAEKFAILGKGKGKKEKVKFIESPTGLLKLGYHIGQEASFDPKQVEMLEELGLAKKV